MVRTHPAFARNDLHPVQTNAANDVIAYRRNNVIVLVNTRSRAIAVTVTDHTISGARDLLYGKSQIGNVVSLPPYGAAILELIR